MVIIARYAPQPKAATRSLLSLDDLVWSGNTPVPPSRHAPLGSRLGRLRGAAAADVRLGTPDYAPAVQNPLGAIVFTAVAAAILRWRLILPPDKAPEATRLFVSFERDWLCRARLDLLVDGERVEQLPLSTAMLVLLPLGLRTVEAFLDRPRTAVPPAIPSATAARAIELEFHRVAGGRPPVLGRDMRLVRVRLH